MTDIDHFCDEKRPLNPCLHDFHLCMRGTCHIGAIDLDYLIARLKAAIASHKAFWKHLKKKEMCRFVPICATRVEENWDLLDDDTSKRGIGASHDCDAKRRAGKCFCFQYFHYFHYCQFASYVQFQWYPTRVRPCMSFKSWQSDTNVRLQLCNHHTHQKLFPFDPDS